MSIPSKNWGSTNIRAGFVVSKSGNWEREKNSLFERGFGRFSAVAELEVARELGKS
jgi:hypothetical protein